MRFPKTWIPILTKRIVDDLLVRELIKSKVPVEKLVTEAERIIMDELIIEDKVNDEVREMLKKYAGEIEKGRLDYRKMFEITKKKIVQERGLIL